MPLLINARRAVLLTLSLLTGCAAADPSPRADRMVEPSAAYGNFLAGRFALHQGDFNTAAGDLLRALAADPGDPELLLQTFIACVNAGRPEAVRLAEALPTNQIAQIVLGNAAAKSGDWKLAVERFRAVPRDGVMQLLQPLLLAWTSQGLGATDQALATLRPMLDNPRFRPLFAQHAGMIAELAGRMPDAAAYYQTAAGDAGGQSPRTAMILASWAARSGQMGEAETILARLAAATPELSIALPGLLATVRQKPVTRALDGLAEAYTTFAAALQGQQTSDFAMVMTRLALDMKPDSATALMLAADIQANAKHMDAALGLLDQAAATREPIAPLVRLRRIAILQRMERTDDAIRAVEQLGRDYPDSPLPDITLGELLRSKQRYAEAVTAYDRVIARVKQPMQGDWILYYSRGVAYERAGQWSRAEADFHQALALSPDQPSVLNYLGYAWADMGRNLGKAQDMIQRAAARRPNDAAITDSLGWVMFRQGKIGEATKLLERAVSLEPVDPTITDHLGDVYWAGGRKIEAYYQWRRALTLNPTSGDAAKLESKIKSHPFGALASGK